MARRAVAKRPEGAFIERDELDQWGKAYDEASGAIVATFWAGGVAVLSTTLAWFAPFVWPAAAVALFVTLKLAKHTQECRNIERALRP